ncbi:MAG: GAF domain-containing sensor histidine kinase [Gloeocapsa sp. UFS-A4-WI-NPMV-4B04]|nr:GAF domain-containing sensor histidine kinase [Gloeocapsa sp. UFS-A4-WI-NPMV-4B04]
MKKLLSSQPHPQHELARSHDYPVRLMQHQQPAQLEQQINEIILNSSAETLLDQIAQALGSAFEVDCCLITVMAENSSINQIGYWHSDQNLEPFQQQLVIYAEQLGSLVQQSTSALVIDDVETAETSPLIVSSHLGLPIRATLAIPIWIQGKMSGVVSLLRLQPHQWSESEKERANASATPVAIALTQFLQSSLISSLQQQVNTSNTYQSLLKQLTLSSRSPLDLNQILAAAIASTAQALQVERGLLITLKYTDPLFKTRSRKNTPKAQATIVSEWHSNKLDVTTPHSSSLLNQSFWLSESWLFQQAFTNFPKPLAIDAEHTLETIESKTDIAPLFNLQSLPAVLIVPLENNGTLLGFLVLQHFGDRLWRSEELALVELVSTQLSNAIIQSQTLRQVQGLVEERTAQLQRSLEVQAKLYEKTRQQLEQLRQVNELKDEFVSTMNHELRTPLTSMSLAIRMLRQSTALPPERQAKYLDILEQQCNQEINLVSDLLKLQELESHKAPLNLETIDLKPKIAHLADSFKEKWANKGLNITLDLPTSLLLQTDAESFERILQELLTNAGKYSDPGTTIILKATHSGDSQNKQIVLSLTNFGPGISPEDVTQIFDKFRRGKGVTQQAIQGTGLGLALVKSLVQHLNGAIALSSNPTSHPAWETCFTLTLPQSFDHTTL